MEVEFANHDRHAGDGNLVFFVRRSTNANVVVYSVEGDQIQAKWLMYEKMAPRQEMPPHEDLTTVESMTAYGFEVQGTRLVLRAIPAYPLTLVVRDDRLIATLDGARVLGVFVQMKKTFIPKVDHIVIHFEDGTTRVVEK